MARPRGDIQITCQNQNCAYYMKEKEKAIIKKGRNRMGHQQYFCFHCGKYFVETKNTPLFHKHLSEDDIINICKHLVEKNGIRSIERITGHHRDTIGRLLEDLGEHASKVNELLIRNLQWGPMELDKMWTFIKKKKRKLSARARVAIRLAMRGFTPA